MFSQIFESFGQLVTALRVSRSLEDSLLYHGGPQSFEELIQRGLWNYVNHSPNREVQFSVHSQWTRQCVGDSPYTQLVQTISFSYVTSGGVGVYVELRNDSYYTEVYKTSWVAQGHISPYSDFALTLFALGWTPVEYWPTATEYDAMREESALANGETTDYGRFAELVTPEMLAERKRAWEAAEDIL